jgi:hypothetical protein
VSLLQDFGVNLAIAAVAIVLPVLWAIIRFGRSRWFWRPIAGWLKSNLVVVIGRHPPERDPAGMMGIGDAKAVDVLRTYFAKLRVRAGFDVSFVDEVLEGKTPDKSMVCIAGPDTSPPGAVGPTLIADLWARAPTSYFWLSPFAIGDERDTSGAVMGPYPRPTVDIRQDYALIVKMPSPYWPGRTVLLFAGCTGYGTWGAVQFATQPGFIKDKRIRKFNAFECLVTVDVFNRAPSETKIVDVRELDTTDPQPGFVKHALRRLRLV